MEPNDQVGQTQAVNFNVIVLNPMPRGVTPLKLRGWLREALLQHQARAARQRGVVGFLFLTRPFVGAVTRRELTKMVNAATKKHPMLKTIAVVDVDHVLTDEEAEKVVADFFKEQTPEVGLPQR